jgi:hypothetical protein
MADLKMIWSGFGTGQVVQMASDVLRSVSAEVIETSWRNLVFNIVRATVKMVSQ